MKTAAAVPIPAKTQSVDQGLFSPIVSAILIGLILTAVFVGVGRFRTIDGDEGFYLLASKLVFQGKVLYRDFFFTQMPLVPYVYGAWMQIAGETWYAARALSAVFAAALGCLLYLHLTRITGSRLGGLLAVFLFSANSLTLSCFSIAKTYAISVLLLYIAYLLVSEYSHVWILMSAGICLGLSIDSRLFLAAVTPIFFACIHLRAPSSAKTLSSHLWFTAGLLLALSPNLYWLISDPRVFYFNNLGYHTIRDAAGFIGNFGQKLWIVTTLVGVHPGDQANLPFAMLVLLNIASLVFDRRVSGLRTWPATAIATVIIIVSLLPTPTYAQYFALTMPFLIPGVVVTLWESVRTRSAIALSIAFLWFYLLPLPFNLYALVRHPATFSWDIENVLAVSRQIPRWSGGEPVLGLWPGYLFQTSAVSLPGAENDFGLSIANKLNPDQRRLFHISSESDTEAGLAKHTPCLVVVGNQGGSDLDPEHYTRMLAAHGYRIVQTVGLTSFYSCR